MTDFGKGWRPSRPENTASQLADRLLELRSTLQVQDPSLVAARSGVSYMEADTGRGELHIPLWGNVCILSWPALKIINMRGDSSPEFLQAFLLYHLVTADDSPLTGRWVSFADLPNGRMYNAAFQSYSGDEIVKTFGLNLNSFRKACDLAGGKEVEIGSVSFVFQALPCVQLMVTYWLGDEEFPSSCKILFDESACHYLPIDACAILGNMLARKLLRS